jgi:transposase
LTPFFVEVLAESPRVSEIDERWPERKGCSIDYLGAQFRRFRTKLGAPVAIKAVAAKLARLVYRMLRYGMKYVDQGAKIYEAQHRQRQIGQLKWNAAKLGFRVVEAAA